MWRKIKQEVSGGRVGKGAVDILNRVGRVGVS